MVSRYLVYLSISQYFLYVLAFWQDRERRVGLFPGTIYICVSIKDIFFMTTIVMAEHKGKGWIVSRYLVYLSMYKPILPMGAGIKAGLSKKGWIFSRYLVYLYRSKCFLYVMALWRDLVRRVGLFPGTKYIYLFISQYFQCMYMFIHISIYLYFYLSKFISIYISSYLYLYIFLSIYIYIYFYLSISIYISIYPYFYLSIFLSI